MNQSARTVIDPDPNLKIQEVGIPIKICQILTFPEVVNIFNYYAMTDLILKGPFEYPGANYVQKKNGKIIDLKYRNKHKKKKMILEYGDVVLRHLQHNDWVLFNRQPSLHRCSMMAHQCVPVIGKSFRLNPAVTKVCLSQYYPLVTHLFNSILTALQRRFRRGRDEYCCATKLFEYVRNRIYSRSK